MRTTRIKGISMVSMLLLLSACGFKSTTGAFKVLDQIESQVQRGMSTKTDIENLLGAPNGVGNALFPSMSPSQEVWFYEDIELETAAPKPGPVGSLTSVIEMEFRQQILLVFFKGETFDGFMWFTNDVSGQLEETRRF